MIYFIHSNTRNQRSMRLQCDASVVRFSCTLVPLYTSRPPLPIVGARPGPIPSAKLFGQATNLKKLLEDQRTNTAVIISYCPMNASFIRERQRYSTVVTAGPLSTHHMILLAIPVWKNIFSSAGRVRTENELLPVMPKI